LISETTKVAVEQITTSRDVVMARVWGIYATIEQNPGLFSLYRKGQEGMQGLQGGQPMLKKAASWPTYRPVESVFSKSFQAAES
jgi:hypothetical protein